MVALRPVDIAEGMSSANQFTLMWLCWVQLWLPFKDIDFFFNQDHTPPHELCVL